MKKNIKILFTLIFCLFMVGCFNKNDVVTQFTNQVEDIKGYHILGNLEVFNGEDKYTYDVEVAYSEDNNFKVNLKNTINNHEQIILRNSEGVYVLTPSLNKSFKFESEWPYNSSQVYLLQTILKDLKNDTEKVIEETEDGYIVTTLVDYSNNSNLVKQKIYFDKDASIKQVEILNEADIVQMKMTFNTVDYNASYDETYFALSSNIKEVETENTSTIDSIIYPMFLPDNTTLTNQEKVSLENGERIILTFDGENPFTLIQETINITEELQVVPTSGSLEFVTGTIGTLTDSTVSWVSNDLEFYVISDVLNQEELLKVANSLNTITVGK